MTASGRRPATYQDVLAAPPDKVAELIGGELHLRPRPAAPHALASSRLGMLLGGPFDLGSGGPGGWVLLDEPELHLGAEVLVPDMAGWRVESGIRGELQAAYFSLPPAWVLEVLSPSTQRVDRFLKLPRYHAARVQHVWLVDPVGRSVEVFRWEEAGWLLVATAEGAQEVRLEPFDAVGLDLGKVWGVEANGS
ncbi:MAG: Uma2 family endonuclease [Myxococcales bacterium]|nr:Uma2 family endonuclease [Myxococcales bacterium]